MKHVFMQKGNAFMPVDPDAINIKEVLPPAVYTVGQTPAGEYFLEKTDDLTLPAKLYGDTNVKAERILATFKDRPNSTGVLLTGEKGSGKTMLAKRVAMRAMQEDDVITILVNAPHRGESFNQFMQGIEQPAVVFFDEFEKTYNRDQQPQLLTIFDGTFSSKKLFLLTCNDRYRIDSYMLNRPGRIFYLFEYKGLGEDFIREYCADNLENKAEIDGLVRVSTFFGEFSFDMLKALTEEMNRYSETAAESMVNLNMKPEGDTFTKYEATVLRDGALLRYHDDDGKYIEGSPIAHKHGWDITLYPRDKKNDLGEKVPFADDELQERMSVSLNPTKLVAINKLGFQFIFDTETPNVQLAFKKHAPATSFNYNAF